MIDKSKTEESFSCRPNCGTCCIVPSISSPIPGMPDGKPAMQKCIHLTENLRCAIFNHPQRPAVCSGFKAEKIVCGNTREEAMENLKSMI